MAASLWFLQSHTDVQPRQSLINWAASGERVGSGQESGCFSPPTTPPVRRCDLTSTVLGRICSPPPAFVRPKSGPCDSLFPRKCLRPARPPPPGHAGRRAGSARPHRASNFVGPWANTSSSLTIPPGSNRRRTERSSATGLVEPSDAFEHTMGSRIDVR